MACSEFLTAGGTDMRVGAFVGRGREVLDAGRASSAVVADASVGVWSVAPSHLWPNLVRPAADCSERTATAVPTVGAMLRMAASVA